MGIVLFLSCPALAEEMNEPVFFSTRQLPSWAEEAWWEYQTERSNAHLKEASDVLARVRKQALSVGIRNFDLPAAVLVQEGEEALSKGRTDEAVELGMAAVEWAPEDTNSLFFLAKSRFHQHPFIPLAAIGTYFQAISAGLGDFWFIYYWVGRLVLFLFAGLLGGVIVFFSILLVRYLPRLAHTLHERFMSVVNAAAVWALAVSLLLMPLFFGAGAGFVLLSGLCLVWLYMSRSEQVLAIVLVIILSLSAFWIPLMISCFTADQSSQMDLVSRVIRGEASASGAARILEGQVGHDGNWPVLFSLAIRDRWEGRTAEALERYQLLLKMQPDQPAFLNNIGNIYFLMKQYENSVTYYQKSLGKNPRNVVSHYNLSLVFRELLRFNEAKLELEAAEQIDLMLIQSYKGLGPIDEFLTNKMLWKTAFAESPVKKGKARDLFEYLFSPLTLNAAPILLLLFAGGVFGLRLLISRKFTATACALCGRAICLHCQRRILDIKTCSRCWSGSKNVRRKADLRQFKYRQRRIHQLALWISVFLPGAGHFYIGSGIRGFAILAAYMGLVFTILFRNRFFQLPGERGSVPGFGGLLTVLIGLLILYILVFRELTRGSRDKLS